MPRSTQQHASDLLWLARVAPDESMLGNATVLAGVLPDVDAIIQTLQYNATDEIITFSASMDPGSRPP